LRRVLVTGGAGFIGSHLVDALVARGDAVAVLDNMHRGRINHIQGHIDNGRCKLITGDIREPADVESAMLGAEVVFHLAAQSNVLGAIHDTSYSFTANVAGTYNVLEAARRSGVGRVVFSSSREVYGDPASLPVRETAPLQPKNPYGASKVAGEAYCNAFIHSYGLDVAVMRLANVYGPRDTDRVIPRWLGLAERGEDLRVFGGRQVLDFVPISLVVRALLRAGDYGLPAPVNVGSGTGTPILALAERVLEASGTSVQVRIEPANECEVVGFVADVTRMRELGIEPPADPLEGLAALAAAVEVPV
jgi:UDP-glucose 4-epimerase